MKINEFIETKTPVQQAIEEHVARGVPFRECIFRPGSTAFREFYRTVRDMHSQGLLELDWEDEELLETDIGELVRLNDEVVPLDVPFMEDMSDEEVDEFHKELDKLVHKHLGHSSDEEDQMDEAIEEIKEEDPYASQTIMDEDPPLGINYDYANLPKVDWDKYSTKAIKEFLSVIENLDFESGYYSFDDFDDMHFNAAQWIEKNVLAKRQDESKEHVDEAEYNGKKVKLNSPKRGGSKKFYVYVKNPKTGRVKKISWGDTTGLSVKAKDPGRVKSFVARHKCKQANDKTTARYWSCRTPRYKSLGVKGGQWW